MSSSVTTSMVTQFKIARDATANGHLCHITLSDGRKRSVSIDGREIQTIVNQLANNVDLSAGWTSRYAPSPKSADELLAQKFNKV